MNFKSEGDGEMNQSAGISHIAIIMDGNGRWAERRGLSRTDGHLEGVSAVVRIVKRASERNVKFLTLYTFSAENWKRPQKEVEFILQLPKKFLFQYLPELMRNNVKINILGDLQQLPYSTREALKHAVKKTAKNDGLQLNFALNYGGRQEILKAFETMKEEGIAFTEESVERYLYTNQMPEPDLLIRTGGEKRLSNFLLWQMAYTEFYFSDVLWPDFSNEEFDKALNEFNVRHRRFGGL
ncbi:isoprenyl transferase [Jeotgalibacillus sp. HH7-29]|uniref:Isoprenyl transferase n=2 Tax=Jeotgalibacillus haloalkalitolerans TaxID=3104292 RepID=A0ABU5KQL9_9BACL|nr:isoprenyl transferase [Jeotgalibacillus sp. HH7-29]MDZ5713470.1 isoprenyl transferase [Jeotgalibacillus sp. HH7-29]